MEIVAGSLSSKEENNKQFVKSTNMGDIETVNNALSFIQDIFKPYN